MFRKNAGQALERLETFNYKATPDFGLNSETEEIIDAIINECKSTVMLR